MPGSDPSSEASTANALETCSKRLEERIADLSKKMGRITIPEMIDVYFLVMETRSHAALLGREMECLNSADQCRIKKAEEIVSQRFEKVIHPAVASQLDELIRERVDKLRSMESRAGSAEQNAGLYEGLREMMSTREFVDQYERGMMHDR